MNRHQINMWIDFVAKIVGKNFDVTDQRENDDERMNVILSI